jgi:vibriolysin
MLKKLFVSSLILMSYKTLAGTPLDLYQAPVGDLKHFTFKQKSKKLMSKSIMPIIDNNVLQEVSQTDIDAKKITRYQQLYKGLPVVGAQIMVTSNQVNGHLLEDIEINTRPSLSTQDALSVAKKSWLNFNPQTPMHDESIELQIRPGTDNELKLVYLVAFKSIDNEGKPSWPFFVVDAQTGKLIKQWNNIKNYSDQGPGGNEKVHEFWYGKEGLPPLEVQQNATTCIMDMPEVKLVNLQSAWDWEGLLMNPYQYPCGNNQEDKINGAFSPINDAYYFGHTIVNMYKEWYGVNALQNAQGKPQQLVMRVHFGKHYDNAFWDGQYMSFGDGEDFYPLVSLDVAGHEVTHGFTEQHANLEYHDKPGALNESLSDMAGQAARAYLLEKFPELYKRLYLEPDAVTWGIGETIVRDSFGKALRFMDIPSSDGSSADCLDKDLAQSHGVYCAISYDEVVAYASSHMPTPQSRQGFIVHTASGIFNKAFYLLSKNIGIKKAYQIMIIANSKYWTPTTDFIQGACGVLHAARDVSVDNEMVKNVFGQVGVATDTCAT